MSQFFGDKILGLNLLDLMAYLDVLFAIYLVYVVIMFEANLLSSKLGVAKLLFRLVLLPYIVFTFTLYMFITFPFIIPIVFMGIVTYIVCEVCSKYFLIMKFSKMKG